MRKIFSAFVIAGALGLMATSCSKSPQQLREQATQLCADGNYQEAVALFEEAIAKGDTASVGQLALIYADSLGGVKADPVRARQLFAQSASYGDSLSQYRLSVMMRKGLGGKAEPDSALAMLEQSANGGYIKAMNDLGERYYFHYETLDEAKAIEWYQKAADLGDTTALCALGYINYRRPNASSQKTEDLLKKAMEKGSVEGMFRLGCLYAWDYNYRNSKGKEGIELINKAAEKGFTEAIRQLGTLYLYGYGSSIPANIDKALEYFKKAADAGNPRAMLDLANYYNRELIFTVKKDPKTATEWRKKACDAGYHAGINDYGWSLWEGSGVEKDVKKALELFHKAADMGNCIAMNNINHAYRDGIGVEKDLEKAEEWHQKAIKYGAKSMDQLYFFYPYY